jgi:hypothetical protein
LEKACFLSKKADLCEKRIMLEQSFPDCEFRWSSLTQSPQKWQSGEALLRSSRTKQEQFASWKILHLREIQG